MSLFSLEWIHSCFYCSELQTYELLFEGTGSFVYTDNDVVPDGQNTNTRGLRLNGEGISINYHAMAKDKNSLEVEKTLLFRKYS